MTTIHPVGPAMPDVMLLSEFKTALEADIRRATVALKELTADPIVGPMRLQHARQHLAALETTLRTLWWYVDRALHPDTDDDAPFSEE